VAVRDNTKAFLESALEVLDFPEPVVEIGSLQVPGQEGYGDIRTFFKGKQFIGCDMRPGLGVDQIENLEHLSFADASVGSLVMLDVIEHVRDLESCFREARRVLKPEGILVIASVMDFPIHAYPYDYWRFTPKAVEELLKSFGSTIVGSQGDAAYPHTVFGLAIPNAGRLTAQQMGSIKLALAKRLQKPSFYGGALAILFKKILMPFLWKGYIYHKELSQNELEFSTIEKG
jgi:SAM-dependent methyltransferase